jgi:RecJ-like exonuclease
MSANQATVSTSKVVTSRESNINKTCNRCGGRGHLARECPSPEAVTGTSTSTSNTKPPPQFVPQPNKSSGGGAGPSQKKGGGIICSKCGKTGHTGAQCWGKNTKGAVTCPHCKRTGHNTDKCWFLHPELRPSKSNTTMAAHSAEATSRGVGPPPVDAAILEQIVELLGQRKAHPWLLSLVMQRTACHNN